MLAFDGIETNHAVKTFNMYGLAGELVDRLDFAIRLGWLGMGLCWGLAGVD